jgi:hypothetical protein
MRRLANYALEATPNSDLSASEHLALIRSTVDDWFSMKGSLSEDRQELLAVDGRVITVQQHQHQCQRGAVDAWHLNEPVALGRFSTTIEAASTPESTQIGISLAAIADNLSPGEIDPTPPRILGLLFELPIQWGYRTSRLFGSPLTLRGRAGGLEASRQIWHRDRTVPIVLVSAEEGLVLHPGIESSIARDLLGLANVLRVDEEAAWCLTQERGKDWSCYAGAIRLYWPAVYRISSPFDHPLWTAQRLLDGAVDTHAAARRLRAELRRLVVSRSGLCIPSPPLISELIREARHEEIDGIRLRAKSERVDETWANELFESWSRATDLNEELRQQVEALTTERDALLESIRYQSANIDHSPGPTLTPSTEAPPTTVLDAVRLAAFRFPTQLRVGRDVWDGIDQLRSDSSTAAKVFRSLEALAALGTETANGTPLGEDVLQWLTRKGERASGESATTNNSPKARKYRTWDDGCGKPRYFEHHLKPKEATSPDQCVRIYFEHEPASGLVIIGWVGRHPPE